MTERAAPDLERAAAAPLKRYEITCFDHVSRRRISIGWSDDAEMATGAAAGAEMRPTWSDGRVVDHGLKPKEGAKSWEP
jgi:hypothetical protein